MGPEPDRVAERLGLDETTIARLRERGHLTRLTLTEFEIRERLYRAHLAHLLTRAGGRRGGRGRSTSLCVLVAMLALVVPHSASAVATGARTVLVVLATSGPQPYTVAEVERTMREAGDFLHRASLGYLRLHTDVTPWMVAFTSDPGCGGATNRGLEATVTPARLAAQRGGYDASRYDDVIYAIADSKCGFQGAAWGHEVMLARQPTLRLIVHELGHAFGLAHAQSSNCVANRITCGLDDTGDPFSPMGSGTLDFSAYEKVVLGWIRPQPRVSSAGRYILARPTIKTSVAQALLVRTAQGTWWIEYRSRPFRGLLVRLVYPTTADSPLAPSAVLITKPTNAGRPWIASGETYRIPRSMRVTLLHAGTGRAEVRFS
jgi:hypothetical protein